LIVSVNDTVPLGVLLPETWLLTVAVNVTDWFTCEVDDDEVTCVVVGAGPTVCVSVAGEMLKLVSLMYVAVMVYVPLASDELEHVAV
jgi:hypothetical protein